MGTEAHITHPLSLCVRLCVCAALCVRAPQGPREKAPLYSRQARSGPLCIYLSYACLCMCLCMCVCVCVCVCWWVSGGRPPRAAGSFLLSVRASCCVESSVVESSRPKPTRRPRPPCERGGLVREWALAFSLCDRPTPVSCRGPSKFQVSSALRLPALLLLPYPTTRWASLLSHAEELLAG